MNRVCRLWRAWVCRRMASTEQTARPELTVCVWVWKKLIVCSLGSCLNAWELISQEKSHEEELGCPFEFSAGQFRELQNQKWKKTSKFIVIAFAIFSLWFELDSQNFPPENCFWALQLQLLPETKQCACVCALWCEWMSVRFWSFWVLNELSNPKISKPSHSTVEMTKQKSLIHSILNLDVRSCDLIAVSARCPFVRLKISNCEMWNETWIWYVGIVQWKLISNVSWTIECSQNHKKTFELDISGWRPFEWWKQCEFWKHIFRLLSRSFNCWAQTQLGSCVWDS